MTYRTLTIAGLTAALSCAAMAQTTPPPPTDLLPGRPDREATASAIPLGPVFESVVAGISFQPPEGGKMFRRPGEAEVVRYVYEADNSTIAVTSTTLKRTASLTTGDLPDAPDPGMLELAAAELKRANPGVQVVRQDTTNVGDRSVGMLAARYTVGTTSFLCQQAIVQDSELSYYTVTYVTPGAKPNTPDDAPPDPRERSAVDTFAAVLDTVKLLDRSGIKIDQDQRLYRTRAFYVNLSQAKVERALVPEQWLRMLKNGKDIGYLYVVEERATLGGFPAIKIGLRSRQFDEKKRQIDAESWLRVTTDRKHENWSRMSVIADGKDKSFITEIGASDMSTKALVDAPAGEKPQIGEKQRFREVDQYPLTVKYAGKTGAPEPVERMLPPWYLPQALGHVLPRLLPTGDRKTYVFATFVPDRREVMMRYVDVLPERKVSFGGQSVRATVIQDKIGLDGYVTSHYVAADTGAYLGSETKYPNDKGDEQTIAFVASNAAELTKLWDGGADLTRPAEAPVQEPAGNGR